jgi:hypothetical protein
MEGFVPATVNAGIQSESFPADRDHAAEGYTALTVRLTATTANTNNFLVF